MITSVTVNGVALDLEGIEYRVTVSHGRNDITSNPQASDASMTLFGFASIPIEIADTVVINANSVARFTGRVSDLTLRHDYNPNGDYVARLDCTIMGTLAELGLMYVGAAGYAKELLDVRVENILTETGLAYANNSDPAMTQLAMDAIDGGYSALDLLNALGTETGGTLCDLPDGNVLWESYSRRGYGYNPAHWSDMGLDTWADVDYVWADVYDRTTTAPQTVDLPHEAVVWSPTWSNTNQTILNDVTVIYDAGGTSLETGSEVESIATYGRRATSLTTQLYYLADAQTRVADILRAQGEPRYALQNIQVIMDELTEPTLTNVLDLISGSRVSIQNTPQPSPIEDYTGVVEGWTEYFTPGQDILSISLSDPRFSYATCRWNEVSEVLLWSGVSPTVQWYNVVLPDDLLAA